MNDADKLQLLFRSLADANRLQIIRLIGDGECSVSELVQSTGLSQPLVSHHLRAMREKGILETQRNGPFIYHRLKDPKLLDAIGLFLSIANSMQGIKPEKPMFHCPPMWRSSRKRK